MVSWRKASGRDELAYEELVEEALCFGWIDSTVGVLDDDRAVQLMTPRKAKSSWTRLNRQRVAELEATGRMTDAGRAVVATAQANGFWTLMDSVEDLIEPPELARRPRRSAGGPNRVGRLPAIGAQADAVVDRQRRQARHALARVAKIVADAAEGRRTAG